MQTVLEQALCSPQGLFAGQASGPGTRALQKPGAPAAPAAEADHHGLGQGDPRAVAPIVVLVKDFVLLACSALGAAGFSGQPLEVGRGVGWEGGRMFV